MAEGSISDLPWLPPPPDDFRARCRALGPSDKHLGAAIQHLAAYRLDAPLAASLGKAIARGIAAEADLAPLSRFRLGILSNATFGMIAETLPAAAARHGVALSTILAPYGQIMQQALDAGSEVSRTKPDAVLIAADHRWLKLDQPHWDVAETALASALDQMRGLIEALATNAGAPAILQTLATTPVALFGHLDRRVASTPHALVRAFNERLLELADETGSYVLDAAALAERIGTDQWFDPVQWNHYKLPFAGRHNVIYADALGRLLGAIRGKARKCLVLDLDNTIWGGVVGDDGVDGIVIGQGDPAGEAFLAVQQFALDLRSRGVILAVSSKNDDAVARAPFRERADMLLSEKHIAVFQANWLDKASNLEAIAARLNIGIDALVLLDDNPAERVQLRAALPMVAVPELPADPSWYPWYLASAGYFEAVAFSAEDRIRADTYASDAQRAEVMAKSRDIGSYLASLDMTIIFAPFDKAGRQRIAQLVNKTNQFNLATRRYTNAEIMAMEDDDRCYTLQVRLKDRFGDLGVIGVVICRAGEQAAAPSWIIDTWLMSCRVLGREIERAMLREVAGAAAQKGIVRLVGIYRPTAKNGMVADHYTKLGFAPLDSATTGEQRFAMSLSDYAAPDLPMTVKRPADQVSGPVAAYLAE